MAPKKSDTAIHPAATSNGATGRRSRASGSPTASASAGASPSAASATGTSAATPATAASSSPPAKKARTGPGGRSSGSLRGVANLTPEQLAKKRANDRESQRAIRERTRTQIETLERRIKELTAQQPYQELQQAIRQKELVEAENADIKRRLQTVMSILQPLLDGAALTGLSTSAVNDHRAAEFAPPALSQVYASNGPANPYSPSVTTGAVSVGSRTYSTGWQAAAPAVNDHTAGTAVPVHGNGLNQPRQGRPVEGVPSMFRTTSAERLALGLMPAGRPPMSTSPTAAPAGGGGGGGNGGAEAGATEGRRISLPSDSHITLGTTSLGHDEGSNLQTGGNSSINATLKPTPAAALAADVYQGPNEATFPGTALPPNTEASCPLDGILLDFLAERHRMFASGTPEAEVVGPPLPDFAYFMQPGAVRHQRRAADSLSQLLTDVILTFPDIRASPEKVATYYGMYLALRWMCHPTPGHHARMLPFARPTPWQLMHPHPVWIDCLPWPDIRDELVRDHARYPFDEFFVPFTKTLSVNWPYGDAAVWQPGRGPAATPPPLDRASAPLELAPLFDAHVRDLRNWSLGTAFATQFPALAPASVRIEDRPADGG